MVGSSHSAFLATQGITETQKIFSGSTPSFAFSALADPDRITVVQVAPAVRAAWGEYFGLKREDATMERR
mgnify:CR=1 FL=1